MSQTLGTGATRQIMKEEALLQSDINQDHFDMLLANLRMDSVFVKGKQNLAKASPWLLAGSSWDGKGGDISTFGQGEKYRIQIISSHSRY